MLSSPSDRDRLFVLVFLALGAVWSGVWVWRPLAWGFRVESVLDLLLLAYWLAPTLLMLAAAVALKLTGARAAVLWTSTAYWGFISIGELVEGGDVRPGWIPISIAALIALLSLLHRVHRLLRARPPES